MVSRVVISLPQFECNNDLNIKYYQEVRVLTERLCLPLCIEDYGLQAMEDTSPVKWHIAHVTWFFETFILKRFLPQYTSPHPQFEVLFNSYYNGIGEQYPRAQRSLLSRPSVSEVYQYRHHVDDCMVELMGRMNKVSDFQYQVFCELLTLGCQHEQQHQELLLTDLKYCWFKNPLLPVYCPHDLIAQCDVGAVRWTDHIAGVYQVGHKTPSFCFDNEQPHHSVYVHDFSIANRLVSNGEYVKFIEDNAYQRAELWLSDGWAWVQKEKSSQPLYWLKKSDQWFEYSLYGLKVLDLNQPVIHLSAYEADAYARWAGCRLPTEYEWEVASQSESTSLTGQFLDQGMFQPRQVISGSDNFVLGRAWQWTSSAYSAYPGYKPEKGAIGEYNGKFMANQLVLRGGSCVTSHSHYRNTYRNFFYAKDQWQFTGLRLAK